MCPSGDGGAGGGVRGRAVATDVFKIAKPLVTGVARDDRIALNSKDYTPLTGGRDPEPGRGLEGGLGRGRHVGDNMRG